MKELCKKKTFEWQPRVVGSEARGGLNSGVFVPLDLMWLSTQ